MQTRPMRSPTIEAWQWQVAASCRGMPSAFFFHPWGERGPERIERVRQAKDVCAGCPVIDECRRHALQAREMYGVWGGLSEDERLILLGLHRRHRTPGPDSTEPDGSGAGSVQPVDHVDELTKR
ncbi:WhiB family transcriptional regulator [Nakamurella multipartita]|jgi:WhiB family redox-sensing transcriptional regulator|uniref:Transcriptional regulator WhiB n=1 Tax=Nakamurella multipartita (strain ATCC 700099 / DSM 44233 / CIP 104796 / JCM 9543 / NBRC 105858 / Y-104) TaxID=479431 RepID=C8XH12_NAKMY|nr:transcription factor WhiB [Nakamurella multipartita DSM 44233]